MPISVVLRMEDGTEVDRSGWGITLDSLVEMRKAVPMLKWVDPYGLTVYNEIQRASLLEETATANLSGETSEIMQEIRRLCRSARRPHQYLWFIGD